MEVWRSVYEADFRLDIIYDYGSYLRICMETVLGDCTKQVRTRKPRSINRAKILTLPVTNRDNDILEQNIPKVKEGNKSHSGICGMRTTTSS